MYARSLTDRLKIQMEILSENFADFIRRHSLRTPLMVMAGVAVVMTLKNGRQTIGMIKSLSGSPFSSSNSAGFYSPYGRTAGSYPSSSSYGGASNQYGAGSSRQQYGTNFASSQMNPPSYGQQGQQQQQQYVGQMPQNNAAYGVNNGIGAGSSQSYGGAGNLRGTSATSTGTYPSATTGSYGNSASSSGAVSTASLIANYGASVHSVQPGLLHDFTSMSSFSGQIETISAPDAPGFIEQMLRSTPGAGKVLVIDGGGTMNALFDSNMAALAQQNGWKGVIINGFVLDPQALMMKQVGVKALGSNPSRGMQMMGQRGVPVTVAGVMFSPGSWVYTDSAGIVVSQQNLGGVGMGGASSSTGMGSYGGGMTGASPGISSPGMSTPGMASPGMSTPGMQLGGMSPGGMNGGVSQQRSYGGGASSYSAGANSYGSRAGFTGGATASKYGRSGSSPYQSTGSSSFYNSSMGSGRKKPSKRTLMAMLIFVCAIIWVLLGE